MVYIIEIEHEWNKSKKGYLANSDALGDTFTTNKNNATFYPNLSDVKKN